MTRPDYLVTVCAHCRTASCWHGEHMCQMNKSANITQMKRSELDAAGREHPDNYSIDKIIKVTGCYPEVVGIRIALPKSYRCTHCAAVGVKLWQLRSNKSARICAICLESAGPLAVTAAVPKGIGKTQWDALPERLGGTAPVILPDSISTTPLSLPWPKDSMSSATEPFSPGWEMSG